MQFQVLVLFDWFGGQAGAAGGIYGFLNGVWGVYLKSKSGLVKSGQVMVGHVKVKTSPVGAG